MLACMCICTNVYVGLCKYYDNIYIYICVCVCTKISMYNVYVYVFMFRSMCVCTFVSMHMCMCIVGLFSCINMALLTKHSNLHQTDITTSYCYVRSTYIL